MIWVEVETLRVHNTQKMLFLCQKCKFSICVWWERGLPGIRARAEEHCVLTVEFGVEVMIFRGNWLGAAALYTQKSTRMLDLWLKSLCAEEMVLLVPTICIRSHSTWNDSNSQRDILIQMIPWFPALQSLDPTWRFHGGSGPTQRSLPPHPCGWKGTPLYPSGPPQNLCGPCLSKERISGQVLPWHLPQKDLRIRCDVFEALLSWSSLMPFKIKQPPPPPGDQILDLAQSVLTSETDASVATRPESGVVGCGTAARIVGSLEMQPSATTNFESTVIWGGIAAGVVWAFEM